MKIASTIFRVFALLLCLVSMLMLLLPMDARLTEESWATTSYSYSSSRIDLADESVYVDYNYIEATVYLMEEGFGDITGLLVFPAFAVTFLVLVASFFVKFLRKFFFAIIPVFLVVGYILAMVSLDGNFVVSGPNNIGSYLGYNLYESTTIRFYADHLILSVIAAAGVVFTQFVSGILDMLANRKNAPKTVPVYGVPGAPMGYGAPMNPGVPGAYGAPMNPGVPGAYGAPMNPGVPGAYGAPMNPAAPGAYGAPMNPAAPVAPAAPAAPVNVAEELAKYQQLLNSGVITQEEFDSKKKQLTGM